MNYVLDFALGGPASFKETDRLYEMWFVLVNDFYIKINFSKLLTCFIIISSITTMKINVAVIHNTERSITRIFYRTRKQCTYLFERI